MHTQLRYAFGLGLALGVPLALYAAIWWNSGQVAIVRGTIPETGGWAPRHIVVRAGQPLNLRLTSKDGAHGFAIGQTDFEPVDLNPGETQHVTYTFEKPGTYTFYCTKWCSVNHWRMRGTIEVRPAFPWQTAPIASTTPPLFAQLGLDLDQPHPAAITPTVKPSAQRGALHQIALPSRADYNATSPYAYWQTLRQTTPELSEAEAWDVVAAAWRANTTSETLREGRQIYADQCAACHGEQGAGDGMMAEAIRRQFAQNAHHLAGPTNFADPTVMLGASPALLQGKIVRGGMGTGMPAWGNILTETQMWAVTDYVWTFQFSQE